MSTTKDPVCNMKVESEKSSDQSKHKGQTYYFCSSECKQAFDKTPERYVKEAKEKAKQ